MKVKPFRDQWVGLLFPGIAILAGVLAVIGTSFSSYVQTTRVENAVIGIHEVVNGFNRYKADCGEYPKTESSFTPLLESLQNANCPNWRGPYLNSSMMRDPWGMPFIYERQSNGKIVVRSLGRDRIVGGE